jgi:hypothetical protein
MRAFTVTALIIASLSAPAAPAYSQENKGPPTARTDQQKKDDADADRAYQATLKATKDKGAAPAAKVDPWQTVRPAAGDNARR